MSQIHKVHMWPHSNVHISCCFLPVSSIGSRSGILYFHDSKQRPAGRTTPLLFIHYELQGSLFSQPTHLRNMLMHMCLQDNNLRLQISMLATKFSFRTLSLVYACIHKLGYVQGHAHQQHLKLSCIYQMQTEQGPRQHCREMELLLPPPTHPPSGGGTGSIC